MRISDWSSDVCSSDLRAEGGAGQVVHHLVEVGVGHDDAVILGPAHRLYPLAVRDAAVVDIMRNVRRADEADRADVGMVENRVDHFLVAVDDLQNAFGKAGLQHQFAQPHRNRSEEHTSELQSLMRISYAVFCLKKK